MKQADGLPIGHDNDATRWRERVGVDAHLLHGTLI